MLNNVFAEQSGKRAVVFLDEFDKTTPDVHKSMLLPFESGVYIDRRYNKKMDCKKSSGSWRLIWARKSSSVSGQHT